MPESMVVVESAKSGDGSIHNVGIRMAGSFQCTDCRQKFDSEWAMKTHWRFIHDPNRHQEDEGDAPEDAEERELAALEAELTAAERRVVAARKASSTYREEDEDLAGEPDREATEMHHKGTKNAGALSDRAVRRERWVAKRAQEGRVRAAMRRSRDLLRRAQRDLRFDHGVGQEVEAEPARPKPAPQVAHAKQAEHELAAAEAHLNALVVRAEALNLPEDEAYYREAYAALEVDQDYAEQLEEQHFPHKESHGAKNTSTLTDKQASCKKWEAAHNKEQRDREHGKKVRDTRREEARDRKMGAADIEN